MKKILLLNILFLFSCNQPDNEIMQQVKQINEKCPKMIDSETRIDGIDYTGGNTIVYKYTLVNLDARNLDTAQFRTAMWPGLLSTIRLNPSMARIRESETTILYSYRDRENKIAYIFTITPAHYR